MSIFKGHHIRAVTFNSETLARDNIDKLPERRLWMAVLNMAMEDYKNKRSLTKSGWASWLFSSSFNMVCDLAGFHPEAARRGFIKIRSES